MFYEDLEDIEDNVHMALEEEGTSRNDRIAHNESPADYPPYLNLVKIGFGVSSVLPPQSRSIQESAL